MNKLDRAIEMFIDAYTKNNMEQTELLYGMITREINREELEIELELRVYDTLIHCLKEEIGHIVNPNYTNLLKACIAEHCQTGTLFAYGGWIETCDCFGFKIVDFKHYLDIRYIAKVWQVQRLPYVNTGTKISEWRMYDTLQKEVKAHVTMTLSLLKANNRDE